MLLAAFNAVNCMQSMKWVVVRGHSPNTRGDLLYINLSTGRIYTLREVYIAACSVECDVHVHMV